MTYLERDTDPLQNSSTVKQLLAFAASTLPKMRHSAAARVAEFQSMAEVRPYIPARLTGWLFDQLQRGTQNEAIAIAFIEWLDLKGLSPLSLYCEYAASLADALRVSSAYIQNENQSLSIKFLPEADEVAMVTILSPVVDIGSRPFIESMLALSVRLARLHCRKDIAPKRVELIGSAPVDESGYKRFFRAPLVFGADRDAVVFSRKMMSAPAPRGNPALLAFLEKRIVETTQSWPMKFLAQVERIIETRLAGGNATLGKVADAFGVTPRTLQRRLQSQGTEFTALLEKIRRHRAREYFRMEKRPRLTQLAYLLGYADITGASRFLRLKMAATARGRKRA